MQKKLITVVLIVLILTAIFFRFWQIRDYVVFLGDEGRDSLILRKMILEKRPTFLGPTASVGGFYLGPIYYWMAAPFLLISMFDPVGPSYMVAAIGVATVFLLYQFLKEAVGFWPGVLAGFLYATAPLIVRYSRSSWNPNPLPFFALLLIYSLYLGIKKTKYKYFVLAGASFGVAIQLHYLAIMLIPISFLIVLTNLSYRKWIQMLISSVIGFLITFSPFLLFEIKHQFPNFVTISEFVTRGSTHGFRTYNFLWIVSNLGNRFLGEISKLETTSITMTVFWVLTIGGIVGLIRNWKNKEKRLVFLIGLIWFVGGLLSLGYYTGQIFDYYFGFMFVAPFFLFGIISSIFWKNNVFRFIVIIFTAATLLWFLKNGFYTREPNRLINQTENVANFVIEKSEGKPYNFALITDHNSDHAYKYFLDVKGYKPTELETLITDQLLIVCESKTCAPLGNPIWEIAGFGRGEIAGEWELPEIGIKVFKLIHWSGAPSPAGKPAVKEG